MPEVVTYWQVPDDESEFLAFLEGTGLVKAVPASWTETSEELAPERIRSFIERHDLAQLLFGKGELQDEIISQRFGDKLLFGVPEIKSCVIGYGRGKLHHGTVTQSNLSVHWEYAGDDASRLISKKDDFVKWSRRVVNWVRKMTNEKVECNGFSYRATRRVKEAVCSGTLKAVLY